jgi:Protein of unknown function (DUF2934)
MQDMEQAIRERAYQLWVESGFEHGNADLHWLSAQHDIMSASLASVAEKAAKPKKAKAPRKKRAA